MKKEELIEFKNRNFLYNNKLQREAESTKLDTATNYSEDITEISDEDGCVFSVKMKELYIERCHLGF